MVACLAWCSDGAAILCPPGKVQGQCCHPAPFFMYILKTRQTSISPTATDYEYTQDQQKLGSQPCKRTLLYLLADWIHPNSPATICGFVRSGRDVCVQKAPNSIYFISDESALLVFVYSPTPRYPNHHLGGGAQRETDIPCSETIACFSLPNDQNLGNF